MADPERACGREQGLDEVTSPASHGGRQSGDCLDRMVGVAQLEERRVVIPVVAGSIPVTHPNGV